MINTMKRILIGLLTLVSLWMKAQHLEHVFIMDDFVKSDGLFLSQNNPNPFDGTTDVYLAVLREEPVTLAVADISGRLEAVYTTDPLLTGVHQFRITVATKGVHALGAHQGRRSSSVILFANNGGSTSRIEYIGFVEEIDASVFEQLINDDKEEEFERFGALQSAAASDVPFRVALSLSPFSLNQFEQGYTFRIGDRTATTPKELQQIYQQLGATEMYVRLATKRHKTYKTDGTLDNTTDGKPDENANVHTFDQVIETCRIAAELDMPVNPEVMCAYIYMDMDGTQAPRFYESEYPELYANPTFYQIMHGKKWEELSLEQICTVLEIYGEFVGDSILATGCTVHDWNLGNEANFGFAGIGIGTPNAFDRKLAKAGGLKRYTSSIFSVWWLKKHVWKYEAQTLAAVKRGIMKAYAKAGKSTEQVKFSTHIATVVSTPRCSASFFQYMANHGYRVETAGISYYPSAPAMSVNKKKLLTKTVTRINKKCKVSVFIGEFSYPSEEMVGPFAGWNSQLSNYQKNEKGQADIYRDVIAWGKTHGMAGIRYWAPDYKGEWYPMSMFTFEGKTGTAKEILLRHKEEVKGER